MRPLCVYVERLGFAISWRNAEGGRTQVAQIERQGCLIILADTWPEKVGKGLLFISLNVEPEEQISTLDGLRAELESKGVPVKEVSWGYRLLVVEDLDGNQLSFNYSNQSSSAVG